MVSPLPGLVSYSSSIPTSHEVGYNIPSLPRLERLWFRPSSRAKRTIEGRSLWKYQCHRLVYYESYQDVQVAIAREKQVKRWRREKNLNPHWQDLAEKRGREMRFRGQSLGKIP